jgi:hypothetical protein
VNTTSDVVNSGDAFNSLREAIICANTTPGADTITVPAGTYTLSISGQEDAAATGDLDITDNLTLNGAGSASTIINGGALDRVFHVTGAYTVAISGVTITGGTAADFGGGILNGFTPFSGILNGGTLTVTDSIISGNTSNFEGGGIYTIGGALTVTNSTIGGNNAYKAGGIFNWLSTVTVTNSTISGNTSIEAPQAGGIFSYGWLTVTNSTISGNVGGRGGGIGNYGVLTVTNSTISGNSATTGGGIASIWNGGGIPMTVTVTNSTISGNSAGTGGGMYQDGSYTITLSNTIVSNQAVGVDCVGPITSNGYNLESSTSCGFAGVGDMQNINPLLGILQDNGGPTFTHALLAGSPAINIIPNGVNGCGTTITTDQRGISRPEGAACDIGAFEAIPQQCVSAPSGMVSWWPGDGNANDIRGSNNGTLVNGATFSPGKVGQAFSLDGTNDYVLVGDPIPASLQIQNEITIDAWIYVTEYPSGDGTYGLGLIAGSQYDTAAAGASIFLDGRTNPDGQTAPAGHIHFQIGDGASFHTTNTQTQVPLNQWVHIAATRKAGEDAKVYYNGVSQPLTSVPWPSGTISYAGAWFAIGQQKDIPRPFKGLIDEPEVFNRAISQSEVQAIYNAGSAGKCHSCTPPPAGMQTWWPGDGNTNDIQGPTFENGTLFGGATYAPGKVGQAFSLNGTNAYVRVTNSAVFDPTTAGSQDAWVKFNQLPSDAGHNMGIIGQGSFGRDFDLWALTDNKFGFYIAAGGDASGLFATSTTVIQTGVWYHVAGTWDSTGIRIYVNGVLENANTNANALNITRTPSGQPLEIGNQAFFGPVLFNGLIDEVEVFNRALSAAEIAALADAGSAGKCKSTPTLGTYPNTSIPLSSDTTITPVAAPVNTTSINVSTSTNFKGTFSADPATGVVRVTNAHPAGTYTVTVTAFNGPVVNTTKTFTLTVQTGTACAGASIFTNAADSNVGSGPASVAIGDFNNDGKQDFAAANSGSSTVSIRLGDGTSGFSGTTNVSVGSLPVSVAIGDFNNDGKQDIAAANAWSNTVSIRLGDGAGGFTGTTNVSVGTNPYSVAIGDFNNDGKQDIAAANWGSNTVSIRLGDGLGGFTGTTEVSVGSAPQSVAIGDFNNDGKQDIAVANAGAVTVSIRLGDGAGGFTGTTNVSVGSLPVSVAIGDFNNDGKQDIAAANNSSNTVSIRLGDGAGGFSGTTNVSVGSNPSSVAIGDFNNDGKQDIAAANQVSNTVSIRLGDGSGSFSGTTNVSVGINPLYSVAIGDFNGDGKQDIATANNGSNTISIRLGHCSLPPTIVKAFGAAYVTLNGSTSLSFTITNPNTTPTTTTGIAFSDTLPAGLIISTPNGLTGSCGGGTITAVAGSGSVSLSGASLAASASCTFSVNVTGASSGTKNNTTGNVTSNEGGTGGTASASVTVCTTPTIVCPGSITKFADSGQLGASINPGAPVTSGGCSPVTVTGVRSDGKALNALYPIGVTLITWTATDASSTTATCGQSIAVMVPSGGRRRP